MSAGLTVSRVESKLKAAKELAAAAEAKAAEAAAAAACAICLDAPQTIAFEPCKHVVVCEQCSRKPGLTHCPICRARISDRHRAFM
jgi:hypothetical protein